MARRWKRPTVRAGGSLLTAAGRLSIGSVEPIEWASVTPADAWKAGFATVDDLAAALGDRDGQLYRVGLGPLGPDPRVALRQEIPAAAELERIVARLAGMDARAGCACCC